MWQKGFANVIKLRLLRWGGYPGFSRWAQANHRVLIGRNRRSQSQTGGNMMLEAEGLKETVEDSMLKALKVEEGDVS